MVSMKTSITSIFLTFSLSFGIAQADTPAISFNSLAGNLSGSNWNLGFEFQANSNVDVTKLGSLTAGVSSSPVEIGLWDSSGNLLASASVTKSSPVLNQFSYAAITPVELKAGSDYYVASVGYTNYGAGAIGATTAPQITYIKDAWNYNGSSLAFPFKSNNFNLSNAGIFGANLQISAVPEAQEWAMMLLGLPLVGWVVRRKQS